MDQTWFSKQLDEVENALMASLAAIEASEAERRAAKNQADLAAIAQREELKKHIKIFEERCK